MSKKCRAYSESKIGLAPADNRKAFYAGWDAAADALRAAIEQAKPWVKTYAGGEPQYTTPEEQPEQEPVAWMNPSWIDPDTRGWASDSFESIQIEGWIPLYTAPRQWQGLTEQEIKDCEKQAMVNGSLPFEQRSFFARAIESKLREKNT